MLSFQKAVELLKEKHFPADVLAQSLLQANCWCIHEGCWCAPGSRHLGDSLPPPAHPLSPVGPHFCRCALLGNCPHISQLWAPIKYWEPSHGNTHISKARGLKMNVVRRWGVGGEGEVTCLETGFAEHVQRNSTGQWKHHFLKKSLLIPQIFQTTCCLADALPVARETCVSRQQALPLGSSHSHFT